MQRNYGSFFVNREDGDATGDGNVDGADVQYWTNSFGASATGLTLASAIGGVTAVPEPTSALLAVFGIVIVAGGSRTRRTQLY